MLGLGLSALALPVGVVGLKCAVEAKRCYDRRLKRYNRDEKFFDRFFTSTLQRFLFGSPEPISVLLLSVSPRYDIENQIELLQTREFSNRQGKREEKWGEGQVVFSRFSLEKRCCRSRSVDASGLIETYSKKHKDRKYDFIIIIGMDFYRMDALFPVLQGLNTGRFTQSCYFVSKNLNSMQTYGVAV